MPKMKKTEPSIVRCVCGTILSSYSRAASERARVMKEQDEDDAEPSVEMKPKQKKGGSKKKIDPFADLCSFCRRNAQAGRNTDEEDEARFRYVHHAYYPTQAKAIAEQRRQGRPR